MEPLLEEREHNQLNTRYPVGAKELRGTTVMSREITIRLDSMKMTSEARHLSKTERTKKTETFDDIVTRIR